MKLETGLLRYALEVFKNTTGVDYRLDQIDKDTPGQVPDALVRLKKDGVEYLYAVEVKARLTKPILGTVIDRIRRFTRKGLIITDYVNPNIADKLKELDIAYIDAVGNAYLKEPGLHIFIKGNKPGEHTRTYEFENENKTQTIGAPLLQLTPEFFPPALFMREPRNQAFQPAGLKVVFALLCDRDLVNAPYRKIAKTADVALGTVGWVIRHLKEQGFLVEIKKEQRRKHRRLVDRKKLLDKWVEEYNEKLRPALTLGRYTAMQDYWWQNTDIRNYGALWGGEVAAAKLTGHLKPGAATIYAKQMPVQLLRDLQMRHDPKVNVEILRQFWDDRFNPDNQNEHLGIAPLIIVYADLLATGDARNIETAGILYDREIAGLIGEN
ncbi:MAG: type IV toxin-antitoxin system AbiEi family antitoxin [Thermodesulfobacteriota bacterium]